MPENTIAQNLPIFYTCAASTLITDVGGTTQNVSTQSNPPGPLPNTSNLNAPTDIIIQTVEGAPHY